jgi:hypothetical protein
MPHLLVTADTDSTGDSLVLAEELTPALFADQRSRDQLVQRVGWAVDDAAVVEEASPHREASSLTERLHRWFG